MGDDGKTRKVKAVQRKKATPITEQATREVKAVKRKPPKPESLGLLPEEALSSRVYRFLETNLGWGFKSDLTTDRYEVQLNDRSPVLYTPQRFSLFPGWSFEVRDTSGELRFKLSLGLQRLVMRKLTILTPDDQELGRLEQRFSLMEVKFDILNPDGSVRFTLYQPAEAFTVYEILDQGFCVARISKDQAPERKELRDMASFEDAFRVDLESDTLDEIDRVLIISAAIFMDRVFHTGEEQ
jgi:hypothetical protein